MLNLERAKNAVKSPMQTAWKIAGRIHPEWLLRRYASLAKRQGLIRPRFILSFDCDTDRDIEVVEGVHSRLEKMGITPVYAVPGKLLERGAETYRRLAARGAEFMNHGHEIHCVLDGLTNTYVSSFFYDQLPRETVLRDIRLGHQSVIDVLGKAPAGFRVPHFGSFQEADQLAFLWTELEAMGYKYSSSTTPLYGFRNGPLKRVKPGFYEIPVSGCHDQPLKILDSWGFRFDPSRSVTETDYGIQFGKMAAYFSAPGGRGLLNVYADPSQIHDWPLFFDCMESVASWAAPSYERLLEELHK
jgi:hypothetical protein